MYDNLGDREFTLLRQKYVNWSDFSDKTSVVIQAGLSQATVPYKYSSMALDDTGICIEVSWEHMRYLPALLLTKDPYGRMFSI